MGNLGKKNCIYMARFRCRGREYRKSLKTSDAALLKEFDAANAAVVKSLDDTVAWMKADLLSRSKGSYAIGAENYARKLRYEDLVDMPLDKLLAVGEAALWRDQEAFVATAKKIDPTKTPAQVMDRLKEDHPTEDDLIPMARRTIEKTRRFLIDKHIVTVPSEVRPTVTETPVYARYGSGASMDTPGAYETKATEAFYYVTPTEKDWDAKHKDEHLGDADRHHSRGVSGALHPIPVRQAVSDQDAEAGLLQQQRRGLGPLLRADDC
jgi:Bacterial protein of unknown function (DUF885)